MRISALDLADTLFHRLAWATVGALTCLVMGFGGGPPRSSRLTAAVPAPASLPSPTIPPGPPSAPQPARVLPSRTFTPRDAGACARAEGTGTYVAPWGVAYVAWLTSRTLDRLALAAGPSGVRVAPRRPPGEANELGFRAGDWIVAIDGDASPAASPEAVIKELEGGGDSAVLVARRDRLEFVVVRACPASPLTVGVPGMR